jgi:hypothetical protein
MEKLNNFIKQIEKPYAITYIILTQLIAIGVIVYSEIDYSSSTIADIILQIIITIVLYLFLNLCFLIPALGIIAFSTIISFIAAISVPLLLFFSLFEVCGSEIINILQYGFLKMLTISIIITPFGLMNLNSLKFIK